MKRSDQPLFAGRILQRRPGEVVFTSWGNDQTLCTLHTETRPNGRNVARLVLHTGAAQIYTAGIIRHYAQAISIAADLAAAWERDGVLPERLGGEDQPQEKSAP